MIFSVLLSLVTASAISLQCGPGSIDPSDVSTGRVCKAGNCCNSKGHCGLGDGYCASEVGCQLGYGQCFLSTKVAPENCGPNSVGSTVCKAGATCANGYCGRVVPTNTKLVPVCGANSGGFKCIDGSCCSINGQCGTSAEHCDGRKGCQPLFGNCTF
ncbi:hypothetical protein HDV01_006263 [Terramyces sp. JEL0728]|nr:hypothetical protein HDV01_006263 [Terramyces sp. JEL0728]